MALNRSHLIALAAAGSAALLLGALAFEHIGGLAPCPMCIWQRYPHVAAAAIGVAAIWIRSPLAPLAGAAAALVTAGIGVFHTGVERSWWEGPSTCSGLDPASQSADELFDAIMNAPLVRCDEVAWEMLGLSMASWNAALSALLAALWLAAALRRS